VTAGGSDFTCFTFFDRGRTGRPPNSMSRSLFGPKKARIAERIRETWTFPACINALRSFVSSCLTPLRMSRRAVRSLASVRIFSSGARYASIPGTSIAFARALATAFSQAMMASAIDDFGMILFLSFVEGRARQSS
jgi:hypothetical protein